MKWWTRSEWKEEVSKSVESARVFRQREDTRNLPRSGIVNLGKGLRGCLTEPEFERLEELKSNVVIKDSRPKPDTVSLIPGSVFTSLEVQVNDLAGSNEVDEEGLLEPGTVEEGDWEHEEVSLYEDSGDAPLNDQNTAMPRGVIGNFGFKSQFRPLKKESEFQFFLNKMKKIYWWQNPKVLRKRGSMTTIHSNGTATFARKTLILFLNLTLKRNGAPEEELAARGNIQRMSGTMFSTTGKNLNRNG